MTAIISTLGGSDVTQIFMHNLAALAKTLPVEMHALVFSCLRPGGARDGQVLLFGV